MSVQCHVAVVGAGPYGLAITAYLRDAGIDVRTFGDVMGFWRNRMPEGMLLRSEWAGSHIADPRQTLTLDQYEATNGLKLSRRLPLDHFIAYALWYQRQAVPEVDSRDVLKVDKRKDGFNLTLADESVVSARRVVIATGLEHFGMRPPAFSDIPLHLAPHSSQIRSLRDFKGLRVVVIGGGQSALELAVLLKEVDARVEVIARHHQIYWLAGRGWLRRYSGPFQKLIYPPGEVGPPGINWIVQLPDLFRSFPSRIQQRIARRAIRPAGSAWFG